MPLSLWYLGVAGPVTLAAGLHPVGNYNHFLLLLAPLCLVGGWTVGQVWNQAAAPGAGGRARLGLAAVFLGVLAQAGWNALLPPPGWHPLAGGDLALVGRQMAALEARVVTTPGDVLAEDLWGVLRAGKAVPYEDDDQERVQAAAGTWDPTQLVADVTRQRFALVITQFPLSAPLQAQRWPPAVLAALRTHYRLATQSLRYVYVPRPAGVGERP